MQVDKLLAVDGLNFSAQFRFTDRYWNLAFPMRSIENFCKAAKASGYKPVIFIDAGIESEEAVGKWRSRREKEIIGERRDVPVCLSILMGDMFRMNGVEVFYSPTGVDNDDFIAKYAQVKGADILSGDIDMFRYRGRTYNVFRRFYIKDGKLMLQTGKVDESKLKEPKDFIAELPQAGAKYPGFVDVLVTKEYRRGVPSSLGKFVKSTHRNLSDLRPWVYAKLGISSEVKEIFPEWDSNTQTVTWNETISKPCKEDDDYLFSEDPYYLFTEYTSDVDKLNDPRIEDYEIANHKMAVALLICELYAIMEDTSTLEFFMSQPKFKELDCQAVRMLKESTVKEAPSVCHHWMKTGACSFGEKCFSKTGHFICRCRRGPNCIYRHP